MVDVTVYGIWETIEKGIKKETDTTTIIIDWDEESQRMYCFIEYETNILEFEKQSIQYPDEVMDKIMKRESHGEDIADVLDNLGFKEI